MQSISILGTLRTFFMEDQTRPIMNMGLSVFVYVNSIWMCPAESINKSRTRLAVKIVWIRTSVIFIIIVIIFIILLSFFYFTLFTSPDYSITEFLMNLFLNMWLIPVHVTLNILAFGSCSIVAI